MIQLTFGNAGRLDVQADFFNTSFTNAWLSRYQLKCGTGVLACETNHTQARGLCHSQYIQNSDFFKTVFTQAWLSRYQRTVSRMPSSNLCAGVQPSSRWIFDASMA